jgi:hypothetical protein
MKTNNENKAFDAVKMKNDIQAKIYKQIRKMNVGERLAFFNAPTPRVTFGV